MRAIAVIPARLASTRLPRKMLREIGGRPLVGVVYEAVRSSPLLDDVVIATDSDDILRVCRHHGWKAQITSTAHSSGTQKTTSAAADVSNPNAVKVVTDAMGQALYFSRATIPFDRDGTGPRYYKHLGFYAYRKDALERFVRSSESSLERS